MVLLLIVTVLLFGSRTKASSEPGLCSAVNRTTNGRVSAGEQVMPVAFCQVRILDTATEKVGNYGEWKCLHHAMFLVFGDE